MSYKIYSSHAFIIDTNEKGEASHWLLLFTEKMGLIRATAQGVRKNNSKLRCVLQKYSFINISMVQGRDVWRVIDAREVILFETNLDSSSLLLLARGLALSKRFMGIGDDNSELFFDLVSMITFASQNRLSDKEYMWSEIILVLKVLDHMGYLPETSVGQGENTLLQFKNSRWNTEIFEKIKGKEKTYIGTINESFRYSQL